VIGPTHSTIIADHRASTIAFESGRRHRDFCGRDSIWFSSHFCDPAFVSYSFWRPYPAFCVIRSASDSPLVSPRFHLRLLLYRLQPVLHHLGAARFIHVLRRTGLAPKLLVPAIPLLDRFGYVCYDRPIYGCYRSGLTLPRTSRTTTTSLTTIQLQMTATATSPAGRLFAAG